MRNKQRRIHATFMAAALLLTTGFGSGVSLIHADADYLNSVTVVMDEELGDLNILTRTKGSYSADVVYTMIYDRLLTLNEDGSFDLGLIESWDIIEDNLSSSGVPLPYPNINYASGWAVQPIFKDLYLYEPIDNDIAICTLREGVKFQNEVDLTVNSLIQLVNFAKAQPTDTLIYQTWAPITITYLDDYTFSLGIDEDFGVGLMDVIYNMASPQGSIVYVEGGAYGEAGYPFGSGAYQLEEVTEYSVSFERWNGWWSEETVPTQYVTFEYTSDSQTAEGVLLNDDASAAVIRDRFDDDIYIDSYEDSRDYYWTEEKGKEYFLVEEDPLALFFNTDLTKSAFGDANYRKAATFALDKDDLRLAGVLDEISNDFWCYLTDDDTSQVFEDSELEEAQSSIGNASEIIGSSGVRVIIYDSSYFSNDTYEQYYNYVSGKVEEYLDALFGAYQVEVNFIRASESQMAAYEANGNYDIMLKEIDLHNVNSARNALYGKGSDEINEWLDHAARALDENTYMLMHLAAQYHNYKNYACVTNLGWQRKAVIYNENVSGITRYNGFCPTGDLSTLDFRFIAVTAD